MGILCKLFKHNYEHVMNTHHHYVMNTHHHQKHLNCNNDYEYSVGIWQCRRCKDVIVDSSDDYVNSRLKRGLSTYIGGYKL